MGNSLFSGTTNTTRDENFYRYGQPPVSNNGRDGAVYGLNRNPRFFLSQRRLARTTWPSIISTQAYWPDSNPIYRRRRSDYTEEMRPRNGRGSWTPARMIFRR